MIYGYCRISTKKQSLSRQVENILKRYPESQIIRETFTGTTTNRPEWTRLKAKLHSGDTVVFDSVSRMSRNSAEGVEEYMEMFNKGINLIFLKEPYIDTDTYRKALDNSIATVGNEIADIYIEATNRVLMMLAKRQIEQAFEQVDKEVKDLSQRTSERLHILKSEGKEIGGAVNKGKAYKVKKAELVKAIILRASRDFNGTLSDKDVIMMCNGNPQTKVSRNTFYKYKRGL